MARTFVDDGVDIYRVVVYSKSQVHLGTYGPYDTYGKAKSQGTRETGKGMYAYAGRDGSFDVQKLEAVVRYTETLGYENSVIETPVAVLNWETVNG